MQLMSSGPPLQAHTSKCLPSALQMSPPQRSLVAGVGLEEVVQLDALVHHLLYLAVAQRLFGE